MFISWEAGQFLPQFVLCVYVQKRQHFPSNSKISLQIPTFSMELITMLPFFSRHAKLNSVMIFCRLSSLLLHVMAKPGPKFFTVSIKSL